MGDVWSTLDWGWIGDLMDGVWQGVVNMLASFSPWLSLIIGLTFGFWVIGKIIDLITRRKEDSTWW